MTRFNPFVCVCVCVCVCLCVCVCVCVILYLRSQICWIDCTSSLMSFPFCLASSKWRPLEVCARAQKHLLSEPAQFGPMRVQARTYACMQTLFYNRGQRQRAFYSYSMPVSHQTLSFDVCNLDDNIYVKTRAAAVARVRARTHTHTHTHQIRGWESLT